MARLIAAWIAVAALTAAFEAPSFGQPAGGASSSAAPDAGSTRPETGPPLTLRPGPLEDAGAQSGADGSDDPDGGPQTSSPRGPEDHLRENDGGSRALPGPAATATRTGSRADGPGAEASTRRRPRMRVAKPVALTAELHAIRPRWIPTPSTARRSTWIAQTAHADPSDERLHPPFLSDARRWWLHRREPGGDGPGPSQGGLRASPDASRGSADAGGEAPSRSSEAPSPPDALRGERSTAWDDFAHLLSRGVPVFEPVAWTDPLLLVLLIIGTLLVSTSAAGLRPRLARRGLLPALLGLLFVVGRFLALALFVILLVEAGPPWVRAGFPWVVLAVAVAVGWSIRDLLPDLFAGAILVAERRVRPGVWLRTEGRGGTVERLGLRVTWLRDDLDREVAIPNRYLLSDSMVLTETRVTPHETTVRLSTTDAVSARRALSDAVATSPWVPLGAEVALHQDGDEPHRWTVQISLRRLSDGARFDGDLHHRVEAILQHRPTSAATGSDRPLSRSSSSSRGPRSP